MKERKGYLLVAAAASLGATSGTFVKLLHNYQFDSYSLAFLRTYFAFLIALITAAIIRPGALRIPLKHIPFFASYAFVGISVLTAFYYQSFSLTTVATAVVLAYTAPIFAMLLARVIYREPLDPTKIIALVIAVVGVVLAVGLYQPGNLRINGIGILFGLGAGLTYALSNIWGKKAVSDHKPLTVVVYIMGFGALFLLPLRPLSLLSVLSSPPIAWLLLFGLAFLAAFSFYMLYATGLRYIEVGRATVVATVEPVIAVLLAFLVLGEAMEPLQIVGALLVISAALIAQMPRQPKMVPVVE